MPDNAKKVEFLKTSLLMGGVDDKNLADLARLSHSRIYVKNQAVIQESDRGDELYTILNGRIDVNLLLSEGKLSDEIATLKQNEFFGESSLLGKPRRMASTVVKNDVELLVWKAAELKEYFDKEPAVGYLVMRNISRVLHERVADMNLKLRNTFIRFDHSS